MKISLPKPLSKFIKPKRIKIVVGGRGSGKSIGIANLCLMDAFRKGIKTACFREFQSSIEDSSHALLCAEIERLGMQGFEIQNNQILLNDETVFKFRGLSRNAEAIKSMHGFNRYFVDEAQTISEKSIQILLPTLREAGSEVWMSANPRSKSDAFSQRFINPFERDLRRDGFYEDEMHTIVVMNYTDNKFFPDVLDQERTNDLKNLSKALYEHIWLGHFYDEVNNSIIPVEWFDSAVDSHKKLGFKPSGSVICAHDPSDTGPDPKGLCVRRGSVVLHVEEKVDGDVAEGCDWALSKAREHQSDFFVWDCDGMGIALKRQVDQQLDGTYTKKFQFRGSEAPESPETPYSGKESKSNRDTFTNRRAQFYWKLRDRFYATWKAVEKGDYIDPDELISISSEIDCIDQLRSEVCRIPTKHNNNGKIQIMSKIEMAKKPYELPSPNLADALMMSMYSPKHANKKFEKLQFTGWG